MTYRIVHVYEDGFEDVAVASTIGAARQFADEFTQMFGAEFAEVYDEEDHVIYQAFAA